eukprot:gene7116-biopygen1171
MVRLAPSTPLSECRRARSAMSTQAPSKEDSCAPRSCRCASPGGADPRASCPVAAHRLPLRRARHEGQRLNTPARGPPAHTGCTSDPK